MICYKLIPRIRSRAWPLHGRSVLCASLLVLGRLSQALKRQRPGLCRPCPPPGVRWAGRRYLSSSESVVICASYGFAPVLRGRAPRLAIPKFSSLSKLDTPMFVNDELLITSYELTANCRSFLSVRVRLWLFLAWSRARPLRRACRTASCLWLRLLRVLPCPSRSTS